MDIKENYIFKYTSFETGKKIINSQSLKFNNPDFFNDPFDCDIDLLEFDFSERSPEIDEDLRKVKQSIIDEAKDLSNRFDDIPQSEFERIYKNNQINKIKRSSICCFSKNHSKTTMWTHYAEDHKGVCLVFDLSHPVPFIDYEANRFTQGPVDYENYYPINYMKSKTEGIKRLFLTKSNDWNYEEEYRYILFDRKDFIKFYKNFLKGVIFGLKVTDNQINDFKKLCLENGLVNLSFSKFKKDRLKLELQNV